MVEVRSLLLFYQFFEYADIFGLLNFDSEHLLQDFSMNQAVEWEGHVEWCTTTFIQDLSLARRLESKCQKQLRRVSHIGHRTWLVIQCHWSTPTTRVLWEMNHTDPRLYYIADEPVSLCLQSAPRSCKPLDSNWRVKNPFLFQLLNWIKWSLLAVACLLLSASSPGRRTKSQGLTASHAALLIVWVSVHVKSAPKYRSLSLCDD